MVEKNESFIPSIENEELDEPHLPLHHQNNSDCNQFLFIFYFYLNNFVLLSLALGDTDEFKINATELDMSDSIKIKMKPFLDLNRRWSDDEAVAAFCDYCNAPFINQFCLLFKRALQCTLKDMVYIIFSSLLRLFY